MRKRFGWLAAAMVLAATSVVSAQQQVFVRPAQSGETGKGVPAFWVRPGYRVDLAATGFGQARFIDVDEAGTVYVSQPDAGKIVVLRDDNRDGVYESKADFLTGYKTVHGMCVADGWLYFTQTGAVYRTKLGDGKSPAGKVETLLAEGTLPKGGGHWWRAIAVKDGFLYTSIGDAGNTSDDPQTERMKIWRFKLDGSDKTLWSSGVRNTEKLRFRPGTDELYGADHGSDNFGGPFGEKGGGPVTDLNPPCEFNKYEQGKFYGHPYITAGTMPRIEYRDRPDILKLAAMNTDPAWSLGGHWAPNGWTFVSKPELLGRAGDAVIAMHGSWNSTIKVGYRLEHVMFDEATGVPIGARPLVVTLGANGRDVLGRPCDAVELADGSVLFSDDGGQRIFRLSRVGPTAAAR